MMNVSSSKKLGSKPSRLARTWIQLTHNGFALLGLLVVGVLVVFGAHTDWRQDIELQVMNWLQVRQSENKVTALELAEPADRVTALNLSQLPKEQAMVARWLSRKYRIAPEPLGALVAEAYQVGPDVRLDPILLLAVMAIESGFNPYAQSAKGAQGLMQVMTHVHEDKYERFGGNLAAFHPIANLRVGAKVLQDCMRRAEGSWEAGLKLYVGAANLDVDDGGYADKVMSEWARLHDVVAGQSSPPNSLPNNPIWSGNARPTPQDAGPTPSIKIADVRDWR